MLQANELINLVITVVLAPLLYVGLREVPAGARRAFAGGYSAMLVAYICTLAEAYTAPVLLNLVEHLAVATGAALILLGVVRISRTFAPSGDRT